MPEYIKALIVLLTIGSGVFYFSKPLFLDFGIDASTLKNRWITWCLLTMAAFLSMNFWIFLVVVTLILVNSKKNNEDPIALFFFLIVILPVIRVEIPGFGGVRYILDVDHLRVATLILLLPLFFQERRRRSGAINPFAVGDAVLLGYFIWTVILRYRWDDAIGIVRYSIYCFVDVGLPYYTISRCIKDIKSIEKLIANFALSGIVVAAVAIFEIIKYWLLYSSIPSALGLDSNAAYLGRGELLRAMATSGQPIVLGYELVAVFGTFLYFYQSTTSRLRYLAILSLIVLGQISSLSKGPWLGFVLLGAVMIFTAKNKVKYTSYAILVFISASVVLPATDVGRKVIDYLPFVGGLDEGSATYRQLLFKKSLESISDNLWTGSIDYLYNMEELRQGQGIIDLVNTYLSITLDTGLIGLFLFIGCIAFVMRKTYAAKNTYAKLAAVMQEALGRVLLSILVGLLFIIAACSPISTIPIILTMFLSVALAYSQTTVKPKL